MAIQSLDIGSIVHEVMDFIDRTFGYEKTHEFAAPKIAVGDYFYNTSGAEFYIYAEGANPYVSTPAEYVDYAGETDWVYVVEVVDGKLTGWVDWCPRQYVIDLIEKGE